MKMLITSYLSYLTYTLHNYVYVMLTDRNQYILTSHLAVCGADLLASMRSAFYRITRIPSPGLPGPGTNIRVVNATNGTSVSDFIPIKQPSASVFSYFTAQRTPTFTCRPNARPPLPASQCGQSAVGWVTRFKAGTGRWGGPG